MRKDVEAGRGDRREIKSSSFASILDDPEILKKVFPDCEFEKNASCRDYSAEEDFEAAFDMSFGLGFDWSDASAMFSAALSGGSETKDKACAILLDSGPISKQDRSDALSFLYDARKRLLKETVVSTDDLEFIDNASFLVSEAEESSLAKVLPFVRRAR